MNAVIIENEIRSSNALNSMISEYCPDIRVISQVSSASEAIEKLPLMDYDLAFFDIDLGDGNAFDVLSLMGDTIKPVIFTTAFNDFAIRAFKYSAIDYLLKPLNISELRNAVKRATETIRQHQYQEQISNLILSGRQNQLSSIALPTMSGFTFVPVDSIIRFQADGSYTKVFLEPKSELMLSYNLRHFEELLADRCFFRVHHSHLINLNKIKQYIKGAGGHLVMLDGSEVDVAGRRKEELMKLLSIH